MDTRRAVHRGDSAETQVTASWGSYPYRMQHDAGACVDSITLAGRRPRTFLGSETAPDTGQVRRRLVEIRAASRRRKSYATCAAAGCTLVALVVAQGASGRVR
jgi:hypothetical protein